MATMQTRINFTGNGLLLNLDPLNIPENIEIYGRRFYKKKEFHVTLINHISPLLSQAKNFTKQQVIEAIKDSYRNKIFMVIPKHEYRYAKKDDRETIIRMCEVSKAQEFFDELNARLGTNLEVPPTHITIYTAENGKAIALPDKVMFLNSTNKLLGKDLDALKIIINF